MAKIISIGILSQDEFGSTRRLFLCGIWGKTKSCLFGRDLDFVIRREDSDVQDT
jgi:hypothetical protein